MIDVSDVDKEFFICLNAPTAYVINKCFASHVLHAPLFNIPI